MATHEVTYDDQGLSRDDPWSLDEYLTEDRFTGADIRLIKESVLSWLREYETADCDLQDVLRELDPEGETCRS